MNAKRHISALATCLLPLLIAACLEEKVLEIVVTGETHADFSQNEVSETWTKAAALNMAGEIRSILADNGYSSEDLLAAHVTSASYGVTDFSQSHDWEISGSINVTYNGSTETMLNYSSQSVRAALDKKISVPLEADGVALINQALQDFIDGSDPILAFTVVNGATTPAPSVLDPMIFDWRAWLAIQVIVYESVEVPDPF